MNLTLDLALTALGLVVLGWGFERYRTRFVKADLAIATVLGFGLLGIAFVPGVYDTVGTLFALEKRYVVISFIANASLLLLILYLLTGLRETRRKLTEMNRNLSIDQAAIADGGGQRDVIQPVIPAYNEEEVIEEVVMSLPKDIAGHTVEPLVVSDGSGDDTAQRANIEGTVVVEHPVNQGQGSALQTGFAIAERNNADVVVTMDGDGQHPAEELERLVRPILEGEADIVVGSRYTGTDYSGNGLVRRAGIRAFTWLINILTKAGITDCTNGYRAIRGSALSELTLREDRYSAPELIIEARKCGLRSKEVPITIEQRQAGETKKPQIRYALGLTRTIFVTWIR